MDSQMSADPFVRNRHRWAAALWIVTLALNVGELAAGWRGVVGFGLGAVSWAVIAYMLGSHKDRDRDDFWRPLIAVWVVLLCAAIGWAAPMSFLDGGMDWRWLFLLVFYGAILMLVVDSFRRTRAGLPWRRRPGARR